MSTRFIGPQVALVAILSTGCGSVVDTDAFQGDMDCDGDVSTATLFVDRHAKSDPFGVFCANGPGCVPIERAGQDGLEFDFRTGSNGGISARIEAQLQSKKMTGEVTFDGLDGERVCTLDLEKA